MKRKHMLWPNAQPRATDGVPLRETVREMVVELGFGRRKKATVLVKRGGIERRWRAWLRPCRSRVGVVTRRYVRPEGRS